ncbi:hypothetical protein P7K49_031518 [Saguinus oedipus]|uniref:Uncharacterized protein n=1 Tax=Saguinus oedipus TaxID=9490 RepID=A0ABQ9U1J2_SAGOE|nr:hypothetical protein P7K49_031518 [Saguinus oedipus]
MLCKQRISQNIISKEDQGEQQQQLSTPVEFADPTPRVLVGKPCVPGNEDGRSEDKGMFLEHKENCTKNPCVHIMNDSEGPVPSEDFLGSVLSHQPPDPSRMECHRENGGSPGHMKEKPRAEAVGYLKTDTTLLATLQGISYAPESNSQRVPLQALQGGESAEHKCLAPTASYRCSNRSRACGSYSRSRSPSRSEPRRTSGPHSPSIHPMALHPEDVGQPRVPQVSVAVALLKGKARSQGLSLDALKQAKLPHTDIPSAARCMSQNCCPPPPPTLLCSWMGEGTPKC